MCLEVNRKIYSLFPIVLIEKNIILCKKACCRYRECIWHCRLVFEARTNDTWTSENWNSTRAIRNRKAESRTKNGKLLMYQEFWSQKSRRTGYLFYHTQTKACDIKDVTGFFSLLYRWKLAVSTANFRVAFYRDVQLLPGGWIFLLPTFSAAFRMLRQYRIILSAAAARAVLEPLGGNCAVLP